MAWNTDVFYCRRQCLLMAQCNSAKINSHQLDLNNHSRGGLTTSNALQYANRNGLTDIPFREVRFYGTATYVPSYAKQLVQNGSGQAYSAVHQSDPIGRLPGILGGNSATGGSCWFCYSHSSYYAEIPSEYLMNSKGQYVDKQGNVVPETQKIFNKEYKEYTDKWGTPSNGNNPSAPQLIKPSNSKVGDNFDENPY